MRLELPKRETVSNTVPMAPSLSQLTLYWEGAIECFKVRMPPINFECVLDAKGKTISYAPCNEKNLKVDCSEINESSSQLATAYQSPTSRTIKSLVAGQTNSITTRPTMKKKSRPAPKRQ